MTYNPSFDYDINPDPNSNPNTNTNFEIKNEITFAILPFRLKLLCSDILPLLCAEIF